MHMLQAKCLLGHAYGPRRHEHVQRDTVVKNLQIFACITVGVSCTALAYAEVKTRAFIVHEPAVVQCLRWDTTNHHIAAHTLHVV